jgi:anthranilate phosphoribosyltransferase/SAM-dependent methyltransferase
MQTDPVTAELYARVIKRLGRNARADGEGVLDAADAGATWSALLEQRFSRPQEAALLMGLRIHGESPAMLAAFIEVTRSCCATIAAPARAAAIVMYGTGTARREPPLAPLLALRLAQRGAPVLLVTHDAGRGANATAVLEAMGEKPCLDPSQATAQLAQTRFAWLPLEVLAPKVARILARRSELGFRNSAHTLLKLLLPIDGHAVIVANYTHPRYRDALAASIESLGLSALLVRGTEGDPVAWETNGHPLRAWLRGEPFAPHELGLVGAETGATPAAPIPLPAAADTNAAARFCRGVLDGSVEMPPAIERQARVLERLARFELHPPAAPEDVAGSVDLRDPVAARRWEASAASSARSRDEFFSRFAYEIGASHQFVTRILELGSGPGFLAHWLLSSFPHVKYTMLDYSEPMHELAFARLGDLASRALCVDADFKRPGWSEGLGRFECVVTMQAVHELRHKRHAVALHAEVRALLSPRGFYLVCDHVAGVRGRSAAAGLAAAGPAALQDTELLMTTAEQGDALREAGFKQVSVVYEKDGLALLRAA